MPAPIFYGWVVVAGTFVVLFLGFGVAYSFSAFFGSLRDQFHATRGDISLVFAITGFLYFLLGAATGPLADRIGPRRVVALGVALIAGGLLLASRAQELWQVYVTYSLGVGLGVGFAYVPAIGAVQRWFLRRRGSASGIAVAGVGVGTVAMPLLATWLIDTLGWRSAYAILGGLSLAVGLPAAFVLEHSPARRNLLPDGVPPDAGAAAPSRTALPGVPVREALRSRPFALLYTSAVFSGLGLFIPFVHLVPYAKDHGMSGTQGAVLIGLIGVGSAVGRLGMGGAADRFGRRQSLAAAYMAMAVTLFAWLGATVFWTLVPFALLFGAAYGGYVALVPALTTDYFGPRNVGAIIGLLYTGAGFGALAGPTLAGFIFDLLDSYTLPIVFGGAVNVAAAACVLALRDPG